MPILNTLQSMLNSFKAKLSSNLGTLWGALRGALDSWVVKSSSGSDSAQLTKPAIASKAATPLKVADIGRLKKRNSAFARIRAVNPQIARSKNHKRGTYSPSSRAVPVQPQTASKLLELGVDFGASGSVSIGGLNTVFLRLASYYSHNR